MPMIHVEKVNSLAAQAPGSKYSKLLLKRIRKAYEQVFVARFCHYVEPERETLWRARPGLAEPY